MAIKTVKPESTGYSMKVGFTEFYPVAVNPDLDALKELFPQVEFNKEPVYIKEDKDGNEQANIAIYLKDSSDNIKPVWFSITKKYRESEDKAKYQWINNIGQTIWAKDEDSIKKMLTDSDISDGYKKYIQAFLKREYRKAYNGEELLMDFMLKYMCPDTRDLENSFDVYSSVKKLFSGEFGKIRNEIMDKTFKGRVVVGSYEIKATSIDEKVDEESGEVTPASIKLSQNIYPRFLRQGTLHFFDIGVIDSYLKKNNSGIKLKYDEKEVVSYVNQMIGEKGGTKNYYILEPVRDFDKSEHPTSGNSTIHSSETTTGKVTEPVNDGLPF